MGEKTARRTINRSALRLLNKPRFGGVFCLAVRVDRLGSCGRVQYSSDGLSIVACVDRFYTSPSGRSLALRKAPQKQCAVLHGYGICSPAGDGASGSRQFTAVTTLPKGRGALEPGGQYDMQRASPSPTLCGTPIP